jgi:lipopolysaccharide heptosyltransferase I
MNILLIRLSSLGDVLHVLPALRALRTSFPTATLGWVVEDAFATLLYGLPELDHLYVLSRAKSHSWWHHRSVATDMRHRLRTVKWDLAIDFQGLWKSLRIARWSGARQIVGYAPSSEHTHWFYTDQVRLPTMDRHAVDRHLDLVSALGCSVRHAHQRDEFERDLSLPLLPEHHRQAKEIVSSLNLPSDRPCILLNFSARKPSNRWGNERFCQLAQTIYEEGMTPVLTGGPADLNDAVEIQRLSGGELPSLVGKCTLPELAALMPHFDVMVTGDTGPMHIAALMGLPVIALFGPANPVRTGPYSTRAVVLQERRSCLPCYARQCKFKKEPPPCMLDLSVELVQSEIRRVLGIPHVNGATLTVDSHFRMNDGDGVFC